MARKNTSKYATLDAVILDTLRRDIRGLWTGHIHTNDRVKAFAVDALPPGYKGSRARFVSARLQHLRTTGKIVNNGISGDGCRWFAVP